MSCNKRLLYALLVSGALYSCVPAHHIDVIDFNIISLSPEWMYYDDAQIVCALDRNIDDITWASSIDGTIGHGNHIAVWLSAGEHSISAQARGITKTKRIHVYRRSYTQNDSMRFLLHRFPYTCRFASGQYFPYVYALTGSAENFFISESIAARATRDAIMQKLDSASEHFSLDTFRLERNEKLYAMRTAKNAKRSYKPDAKSSDTKQFHVVNTANQSAAAHTIQARRYFQGMIIDVWIEDLPDVNTAALDMCINLIETLVVRRVEDIWGKPADIDSDGKTTLLFSSSINNEKRALGFFNPLDFFKRNADTASAAYNPASNEADMVYLAFPSANETESYYYKAIAATAGHELTHAVTFTKKTWNRLNAGIQSARQAEIFLDEGWSHLSENLCGLGASGGNMDFFKLYIDNTADYSFCKRNKNGQDDSAGQRGAMTMFLSWVFWKQGGMSFDPAQPVCVIDTGGIRFLQTMIESEYTDWDAIGQACGKPTDRLFTEMLHEIQFARNNAVFKYKRDAYTGEPAECMPAMGEIKTGKGSIVITHTKPIMQKGDSPVGILPYSFISLSDELCAASGQNYTGVFFEARQSASDLFFALAARRSSE